MIICFLQCVCVSVCVCVCMCVCVCVCVCVGGGGVCVCVCVCHNACCMSLILPTYICGHLKRNRPRHEIAPVAHQFAGANIRSRPEMKFRGLI